MIRDNHALVVIPSKSRGKLEFPTQPTWKPSILGLKELELLSNLIASNRNYSAMVPRNVISTSVRANRVNRIVTPLTNVSKLPSLLPSLLPGAAIQGVVRVVIDEDSIEIYHNEMLAIVKGFCNK